MTKCMNQNVDERVPERDDRLCRDCPVRRFCRRKKSAEICRNQGVSRSVARLEARLAGRVIEKHDQVEIPLPVSPGTCSTNATVSAFRWAGHAADRSGRRSHALRTLPLAPHLPLADAEDLGRLPPVDLLRHRSQDHFLHLHRPLHRGPRIALYAPLHGYIFAAR